MAKKISIPTDKIMKFLNSIPKKIGPFFKQLPKKIVPFLKSAPNKIVNFVKNFPNTFKMAPMDEKIAYGVIGAGVLFLILGIIL